MLELTDQFFFGAFAKDQSAIASNVYIVQGKGEIIVIQTNSSADIPTSSALYTGLVSSLRRLISTDLLEELSAFDQRLLDAIDKYGKEQQDPFDLPSAISDVKNGKISVMVNVSVDRRKHLASRMLTRSLSRIKLPGEWDDDSSARAFMFEHDIVDGKIAHQFTLLETLQARMTKWPVRTYRSDPLRFLQGTVGVVPTQTDEEKPPEVRVYNVGGLLDIHHNTRSSMLEPIVHPRLDGKSTSRLMSSYLDLINHDAEKDNQVNIDASTLGVQGGFRPGHFIIDSIPQTAKDENARTKHWDDLFSKGNSDFDGDVTEPTQIDEYETVPHYRQFVEKGAGRKKPKRHKPAAKPVSNLLASLVKRTLPKLPPSPSFSDVSDYLNYPNTTDNPD